MNVQAVIFDIGNVLIGWQPERHFDRVVGEDRRRALFAALDLHGMNDRVDRGESFHAVLDETIAAHPDWAEELTLWREDWLALTGPVIEGSVELLRRLRDAGVPVFALSNFGVETFAMAEPAYPVLAEFDRRYISGQMAMAKPDAAIYAAVEADCGLPPASLLFIDDRADNIAAAEARGWQGHLFDGPEGLRERLVAEGLLED